MKKGIKISLIVFGVIALILIGIAIVMTTPKNIGVKYTKADLISVNSKLGMTYNSLSYSDGSPQSVKLSGKRQINTQITESELTALLNQPNSQWKDYPLSHIQLKINDDGSVEMTGKILTKRLKAYSEATNMPEQYKSIIEEKIDLIPVNPSFDYKGNYQIKNGKLEGEMTELKFGPLTVPKDWTDNNKNTISNFITDRMNSAGMQVESATFVGGKLSIKGTIPETIGFEK